MSEPRPDLEAGAAAAELPEPAEPPAAGTLYVVATPIGNLSDISLRALELLRSVPLIAAEDTRMTSRLLARHDIETRMTSYHAYSSATRLDTLIAHLRGGADLALVSDAGTPGISDPGDDLVVAWAEAGGQVVAIPGASAVLTAVAATGIAGPRWSFEGFLPRAGRERRERIGRVAADPRGTLIYEAPRRVAATLRDLASACGPGRSGAVCRELTKRHESVLVSALGDLADAAADGRIPARGEFVLIVGERREGDGGPAADDPAAVADADEALAAARAEVERLSGTGIARGEAAKRVAAATGIPRRRLYGAGALR